MGVDVCDHRPKNTAKLPQTGADGLAGSAWRKRIVGRNGMSENGVQYPTAASETESTRTTPDKQEKYACAHDKRAILLDKTEPHRKASRMFDWFVSGLGGVLTRGHCGKFHGFHVWGTGDTPRNRDENTRRSWRPSG